MLRFFVCIAIILATVSSATADDLAKFEEVPLPVGPDAREPSLYATQDGRLLMSWFEWSGDSFAVKVAAYEDGTWSEAHTVAASPDLVVNWADFPSVSEFSDGTIIVHWLQTSGNSAYAYDVRIALSRDNGETWKAPIVPHRDGTEAQHGFVTLEPLAEGVIAVWLDGRAYEGDLVEEGAKPGQMQLRSTVMLPDGSLTPDIALDFMTCSCCQTSAAVAGDTLLVVYRDRSEDEIRDISLLRLREGRWSTPVSVHEDNWELSGCPVNGPSIAARDRKVVVAWFTGAGDVPAVNVAFSNDAGASFGDAVRVDQGQPIGRVDTLMLNDGMALISWLEWQGSDEALLICRVSADGCISSHRIASNSGGNSMNFPQLAATPDGIYVAWTNPLTDGRDTIRMVMSEH